MAKSNRNRKSKKNSQAHQAASAYGHSKKENIHSDVLGSYTGTPYSGAAPEQDADDL